MFSAGPYRAPWAPKQPPKIYVGANGPKMLQMAGALADGVMLSDATESLMPQVMTALDAGLASAGRSRAGYQVNNFWAWHVKADREAAEREARRELVWRGAMLRSHTGPFLSPEEAVWVEQNFHRFLQAFMQRTHVIEGVPESIIEALVEGLTFTGDESDIPRIVARLRSFEAAGQNAIALRLFDEPEVGLRMIGEQLLPAMRAN
jgi:alkanesulfonate monooxygenase SsuD/methylene tetrahydromethanopterin reductase-like flavin-dependent oxidoreductase (luciferase family)